MDWTIKSYDCVASTQDSVKELARAGAGEGLVVHALAQESGRGRHGRVWKNLSGNLYLSVLLKPRCEVNMIGQISILSGLAVYCAALDVLGEGQAKALMLKWPNDLLLGGHKCAGILLETEMIQAGQIENLFLGIGVNLTSSPKDMGAALQDHADQDIDIEAFRDGLLGHIHRLYSLWQAGDFDMILKDWSAVAHAQGAPLSVKLGDKVERGFFHEITVFGHLILSQHKGHSFKTITAGDVYLKE